MGFLKKVLTQAASDIDRLAHPEEHGTRRPQTTCPDCDTVTELGQHTCKKRKKR